MHYLAADMGGTRIKIGLMDGRCVLERLELPAGSDQPMLMVLPRLLRAMKELLSRRGIPMEQIAGVGLCVPTLVNAREGRILSPMKDKYPDLDQIDLISWIGRETGWKVTIENDAHAALLGEWQLGAGRGIYDLVMITLGTGIGTSVLMGGRPLRGSHWQAGVLGGHMVVGMPGRRCGCGGQGCVEAQVSRSALLELAQSDPRYGQSPLSAPGELDYARLFAATEAGDPLAGELLQRSMEHWGALLTSLVHSFDPTRVIIGGGLMRSSRIILPYLQSYLASHGWTPWGKVTLCAAELGDDAALLGMGFPLQHTVHYL